MKSIEYIFLVSLSSKVVTTLESESLRWSTGFFMAHKNVHFDSFDLQCPQILSRVWTMMSRDFPCADFGAHYGPLSQLKKCVKFPNFQVKNPKIINKSLFICCG